ncbi:hypothetical protein [Chryseobacterium sp. KMC2]|uniref:hypothetical protein n=1 Tax=Chryseobacterium sp. KMC2 TaxID=2800705 RepID=UPI0019211A64|nr:hypothetical protein [Chryseobacterium sp. KMC2]MBL3548770.1 hypothetical protein [Chryseobacterium sp. KMC2]
MENTLRIQVNFNEKIIRKQLWTYFYYSWKKKMPTILRNFFYVLFIIFIFDSLLGNKTRYNFLQFVIVFLGLTCIFYLINFYYQKITYSTKINKHIDELKGYHPVTELYFDEENFYIKGEQYDVRSIWKKITYEVSGNIILIQVEIGTPFIYVISEEETDQYSEILSFLKHKAKSKKK